MSFSDRLYEELRAINDGPDFHVLCEAIGGMFQPVEDIAGDSDAGDVGYGLLMDIDQCPDYALPWLSQFVGVVTLDDLSADEQRALTKSLANFATGRPASIIAAVQATLTGSKFVWLRERDGSAWKYTVITRADETPSMSRALQALLDQKPAPDVMTYEVLTYIDYEWLKEHESDYAALESDFATYEVLKETEL